MMISDFIIETGEGRRVLPKDQWRGRLQEECDARLVIEPGKNIDHGISRNFASNLTSPLPSSRNCSLTRRHCLYSIIHLRTVDTRLKHSAPKR